MRQWVYPHIDHLTQKDISNKVGHALKSGVSDCFARRRFYGCRRDIQDAFHPTRAHSRGGEAALMLSISKRSLDYLIASGDIAVRRIGTRVLIQAQELERFARGNHPGRLAG
jgi:excisionase family DNA binding protein